MLTGSDLVRKYDHAPQVILKVLRAVRCPRARVLSSKAMRVCRAAFASLAVIVALGPEAGAQTAASAQDLAQRIEARHRKAADLTARFTQTYRSRLLGREIVERGAVSIKKPGRMLWEYQSPEKKLFVSDGTKTVFYVPADKQVIERSQTGGDKGLALSLLTGDIELLAHFDASVDPESNGKVRLRLVPRKPDPEIASVLLETDDQSRISTIDVIDAQGNRNTFRFEGIRENVGLKDSVFRFVVPKGVEVISG